MDFIATFFMQNIVYVYFFYGLAFFAMGLVVMLESGRTSEFRFARALLPLALFALLHAAHEWFEMFQIFAAHQSGYVAGPVEETFRIVTLVASFLLLLNFGTRLLPGAEERPHVSAWQTLAMGGIWALAVGVLYWRFRPAITDLLVAADVLARYSLAIPGSALATIMLLRERRDFHARGMSRYGQSLLWAALAFLIYGVVGQLFTRPSLVFPSQTINTALFLRTFGIPIQLLRGLSAAVIALTLGSALRAFELEGRIRLARANKARIEAQAAALQAQQRRADEVEALNVQLRATAGELSAMVALSRILAASIDLRESMDKALEQVVHSIERACCAQIFLARSDGQLEPAGQYRRPQAPTPSHPPPVTELAARAARQGIALGADIAGEIGPATADALAAGRAYRALGLPLLAKGQTLGSLVLASLHEEAPLGEAELNLLNAFSQQIAAAVENARLYRMVQEREAQLERLVGQLVNAQEGERQRIARELHDETGQKLTALAMGLAAVEQQVANEETTRAAELIRNLRELSDEAIIELRHIMADLRPAQLDDLGLTPALRWYVNQYQGRHPGIKVSFSTDRLERRLPPQHETVLFRAAQEALTNVARHAQASHVTVALTQTPDTVRLEVADNGVGFDVNAPAHHAPGSGLGLVGMRERVALVGGRCVVTAEPGGGTRVLVELPLR